jgi:hypothetical protein
MIDAKHVEAHTARSSFFYNTDAPRLSRGCNGASITAANIDQRSMTHVMMMR